MKKEKKFEKIVKWKHEEDIIIPIAIFITYTMGFITAKLDLWTVFFTILAICFIGFLANLFNLERKVYWRERK